MLSRRRRCDDAHILILVGLSRISERPPGRRCPPRTLSRWMVDDGEAKRRP
jgi:hypothetical protein